MPNQVILTLTDGGNRQTFTFNDLSTCLVGRHADCNLQLPDDKAHSAISRYHCLLDLNPPYASLRDFGSLNGTYLNGVLVGQRLPGQAAEEGRQGEYPVYPLNSGDTIKLGNTSVQIQVTIHMEPAETLPLQPLALSETTPPDDDETPLLEGLLKNLVRQAAEQKNLVAIQGYDVERRLGRGGFGEVYLARHQQTGEQVAIKLMLPDVATNSANVQRFLDEAEMTKALDHPHVVKLKDCGYSDGLFFFTLEYCDGGCVDKLLAQRGGRLSLAEALPIIYQTLDGLHYAHNLPLRLKRSDGSQQEVRGLVHRDISPHNIFLANSDQGYIAKLGDYGLAKAFEATGMTARTGTGMVAGKPVYMPRQQLLDFKRAKPEVDVWAVAACLYNLLTGKLPRRSVKGQDPFLAILKTDPVPIRERDATIPPALAQVIDLALKDNPTLHFQDALSFKQALMAAMS